MAGMYGCFKNRHSDSAAMASGTSDVTATQEPAEVAEECSGKKKSKFQTFKKFFARKKRKEPPAGGADAGLKASQSSDNVSKTSENNALTRSEKDKGSGSKISLGSKALSHDSVFVSDSSEANEALGASQDSIHGKVKSLQLQLKQAIKLGSPPSLNCVKRTEDAGTMSEDDGLPCSPPEYTTMNQAQRNSSVSLEGADSDDDQLSCAASSRAVSPLVVPGDFSQPASPYGCLDNSAAKHKRGLRNKACQKRKPIKRLEIKADRDSEVEKTLDASITEALEEKQNAAEVVKADELKPEVEAEEKEDNGDNDEEMEKEVKKPLEHSLLRDKDEKEEEEEESFEEQDGSQAPDTSSAPELRLSEEETPDGEPPPSSETSSRASSSFVDSPRATPEPPVGPRESTLDPSSVARGAVEERVESELKTEEIEIQYKRDEESSLLQEVLSSLKTPLESCSLGMETKDVLLEVEEKVKEREGEGVVVDENEEVMEEDVEMEEPVIGYQAAPAGALLSDRTTTEEEEKEEEEEEEEEEERVEALSRRTPEEEEKAEDAEEVALVEEEEPVAEDSSKHDEEEAEEAEEQNSLLTVNTETQPENKNRAAEEESEGEEVMEVEKEPEVEELEEEGEALGNLEAKEATERVEEAEAAEEDEEGDSDEEMMERRPTAAAAAAVDYDDDAEEVETAMAQQEADEGVEVVVGDDALFAPEEVRDDDDDDDDDDDEVPAELDNQVLVLEEERESLEASSQRFEEERRRDGKWEGEVMDHTEDKSDEEEEGEANQPDADPTEQEEEQHEAEKSIMDTKQTDVPPQRPSLSLPQSREEVPMQEDGAISPSKTRTTTLHINLLSPSSEKSIAFFQQSPPAAHPKETETASHAVLPSEQNAAPTEEEATDAVEPEEEEQQQSAPAEERPAAVEETAEQLPSRSGQNKVRFTIAPAWQRSLSAEEEEEEEEAKESLTPAPSEPACVSSPPPAVTGPGEVEDEATANREPGVKAESESSAMVEPVLSPASVGNAGAVVGKPQSTATSQLSPIKAATSATASTEEPSVIVEGNPDNPFGVKLRKTSVLHRFSSEEESTESPVEPPAPATSSKVDPPQPVSVKPSITQPNINKPALPKKPDLHGDSAGKNKRISDPPAVRSLSGGSESPSWISVAKQKQKIYKENSLEEMSVKKEEQEKKSSLPMYVASAASRENSNKTADSKVSPMEISKPPETVEETRKTVSPLAPVPYHPPKSLPCPIPPKPQVSTAKPSPQRFLPTPVPVPQKSPSCTSPSSVSNTPQPQSTAVTSPPFSPRTAPEKSVPRAAGLPSQTPSSPRGLPPQALPQDEPPWMALAKKKAKAWSEMPQIVQ